jgi:hypothetical protein
MLILSYFDRTLGPRVFLTNPDNLINEIKKEYVDQIVSLLNSDNKGFFTHTFSPELKTANFLFTIDSKWARGRNELVMISVIISEEEPEYDVYEKTLSKFQSKLREMPEIFKAFYNNGTPEGQSEAVAEKLNQIKSALDDLYKIVLVKRIETEGQLIAFSKLRENKSIGLSKDLINKIAKLTNEKKNCFLVYRTRGEAVKLDIIPVDSERIFDLIIIFGEQMTIKIIQQISQAFSKFQQEVSMIFTSGICYELDKCIYEVYINTELENLNEILDEIYKIPGIIEIDVKLIELKI